MLPIIERGWWVKGVTTGPGVAAISPDYVAFVPTQRPKNLLAEVAWGVTGFVEVGARKIDPDRVIGALTKDLGRARVEAFARSMGGHAWSPADVRVHENKILLRPSKRGLWFLRGGESIRLARALSREDLATVRGELGAWTWE